MNVATDSSVNHLNSQYNKVHSNHTVALRRVIFNLKICTNIEKHKNQISNSRSQKHSEILY